MINCYLDYIMMTITINGETLYGGYPYSEALIRDLCSKVWVTWETPRLGPEDEIEIRLLNPNYVMNAYARQICLMLVVFELFALTRRFLSGIPQKIAGLATAVSAGVDAVLMFVSLMTGRTLFGLMLPWSVVHVILLVWMVLLCVYQLWSQKCETYLMLCGGCVLYATMLRRCSTAIHAGGKTWYW